MGGIVLTTHNNKTIIIRPEAGIIFVPNLSAILPISSAIIAYIAEPVPLATPKLSFIPSLSYANSAVFIIGKYILAIIYIEPNKTAISHLSFTINIIIHISTYGNPNKIIILFHVRIFILSHKFPAIGCNITATKQNTAVITPIILLPNPLPCK